MELIRSENLAILNNKYPRIVHNKMNMEVAFLTKQMFDILNFFSKAKKLNKLNDYFKQADLAEIYKFISKGFIVSANDKYRLKYLFQKSEKSQVNINSLAIFPTLNCNFDCDYCIVKHNHLTSDKDITIEILRKGLNLFVNNIKKWDLAEYEKNKSISFWGGEPLLKKDIIKNFLEETNDYYQKGLFGENKINFSLATNGSLIDNDFVKLIKKYKIAIQLSLDGIPDVNDKARYYKSGDMSSKPVIEAIRLLNKNKIYPIIAVTISDYNFTSIIDNIEYIKKNFKYSSIGFNQVGGINKKDKPKFSQEEYIRKTVQIMKLLKSNWLYSMLQTKNRLINLCNGYGNQIVLRPDGQIGPCHYLNNEDHFIKVNENLDIMNHPIWVRWARLKPIYNDYCQKCDYLFLCGGSCALDVYRNKNVVSSIDQAYCNQVKKTVSIYLEDIYKQNK